ncbi:MAG TPA: AraC family transcriptional regulator [Actinopolymorphaceae bacterium]
MTSRVQLPEHRSTAEVLAAGTSFGAEVMPVVAPVPPHGHDYVELAVVLGGVGSHVTREGAVSVRRGHAVAVRASDWHGWDDPRDLIVANVYVDQILLRAGLAPFAWQPALRMLAWPVPAQPPPGVAELSAAALAQVENAVEALTDRARVPSTAAIGHLLVILGAVVDAVPAPAVADAHPAVLEAVRRLESDLTREWTVPELARAVGVSDGHLSRSFHRAFGAAPIRVLSGLRAERAAAHLIASDEPVAMIGRRVGWPDPNYFARRFKAVHGVPPSDYRARFRRPGSDVSVAKLFDVEEFAGVPDDKASGG